MIWEDDILRISAEKTDRAAVFDYKREVKYEVGMLGINDYHDRWFEPISTSLLKYVEIIGTIHDNVE